VYIIHDTGYRQAMRDVIVETLQRRNSIDIVDKDGRSPFLAALSHGVSEVEVYILENSY
jgi:hypothetical protein